MEAQPPQSPLKVCPNCSVASRTDAESCPSCGKPYQRQLWQWRWWLAIPIVALAFAAGYFGISELIDDNNPAGITVDEAGGLEQGISLAGLEDQLGESPQYMREQGEGGETISCAYYGLSDEPDAVWEFCFQDDKLVTSNPLLGDQADQAPAPTPAP